MNNVIRMPETVAQDFTDMNPQRQAWLRATMSDTCTAHLFQEQKVALENVGLVIISPRFTRTLRALDKDGRPVYGGRHDELQGMYWAPEPSFCAAAEGLLNQDILNDPLLAFRDGKEVRVWSRNGCTYKTPQGDNTFFGGPFDEVFCMDYFVPQVRVQFQQAGEDTYSRTAYQSTPHRFLLGRQGDAWMLNDIRGRTAASGKREELERIIACTVQNGELTLFSL